MPHSAEQNKTSTGDQLLKSEEPVKDPEPQEKDAASKSDEQNPCGYFEVQGYSWLDQTHSFVQQRFCEPAVWFDGFFGEDHILEDVRPGSFIKWRNTAHWIESSGVDYVGDFTVRWRLPRLESWLKKARLFLVSGADSEALNSQPGKAIRPGSDPATGDRKTVIGIQLDSLGWLRSLISIDTGVKIRMPPDPFIRMRYQHSIPFSDVYLMRLIETALLSHSQRFTETTEIHIERKVSTFTLLRWSNYATYREGTAGISWNSGISLISQMSSKSAISYDASIWGVNHPDWTIDDYRLGSRYRRNFYRPWLFVELEPQVTWPKDSYGGRSSVYALSVILEVQFGK